LTCNEFESYFQFYVRRLSLLFLIGCAPPPPHATAVDAERGNVALGELQEGRTLLIRKCGGCHRTPLPTEHTSTEWPTMIDEMAERSKLDAQQRKRIERYLVVMSNAPKR
jgi:hypothetical protein